MTKTTDTTAETSKTTRIKQSLAQRDDFAGTTYRTIRDNPKTSAAIATGVAAAAAGAGAFLWNRNRQQREAVEQEVSEMNNDAVEMAQQPRKDGLSEDIKTDTKVGSVAY
ncbi:hypothetical protein [Sphingomicrobium clamense]|uniref:YtxH domain-containing protein n=1 Tax=Sphingomicrobium clamense TaxID=2851013 RepID=A0ABS6V6S8_9SPHN|nr:hypothetical protein [Sphingomicrobium sp. B8]MBW0145055.1 hypothetical protein [Sphingomicrobium sp. B8]